MTNKINLPEIIKNITFHFIKIHYKNYLKNNNLKIIPDVDLEGVINNLYNDKQSELKKYIRGTMRRNFPDYNTNFTLKTSTEEILLEIFDDPDYAKSRLVLEIKNYQNN
jgi:hypothetical protein|tara:strand:- start:587 stop:913 length:327 start_codon:yes stop_codon:yes gene_type:complete